MRLLTFIIVGAAVGYGINYMIKKDESGRSILDDIADRAPDLFDQARRFTEETVENISGFVKAKSGI
jgi:hypothetical protein